MYADYSYYIESFKGRLITDEATYKSLAVEAEAYLNTVTRDRIDVTMPYMDNVKKALCSLVEVSFKQEQDESSAIKQSESIGNHSVSYAVSKKSPEEYAIMKMQKLRIYLAGTGLLYMGLSYGR